MTETPKVVDNRVDNRHEGWNAVCQVREGKIGSKFIKNPEDYSKNLTDDWKTSTGTMQH